MTQVFPAIPGQYIQEDALIANANLNLESIYDRYAPIIYGSIIKMGLSQAQATEVLSLTFLETTTTHVVNSRYKEPQFITLLLFAWKQAQQRLNRTDSYNQNSIQNNLSKFLQDRGFTASQISSLIQHPNNS